jgi:FkbM family methyltransferase
MRRPVIWFEANPSLLPRLKATIAPYFRQEAFQGLLFDTADVEIEFKITNYEGGASSAFDLSGHSDMYPGIEVTERLTLRSTTLSQELQRLDPDRLFDILVLDVQGAELNVLQGAGERLLQFKWIYAEASDFELYAGGCLLSELQEWLLQRGFKEQRRFIKHVKPGLGQTMDVLFQRVSTAI